VTPRGSTIHVLTPFFKANGGVVKIMDYVIHALAGGYRVSVWCPDEVDPDLPLFAIERFRNLTENPDVRFHSDPRLAFRKNDLAFVSLPTNYELAYRSLSSGLSPERIIHIIQNVRHANPKWLDGYPLRLLTRPAARISTNPVVHEAIAPWLDPCSFHAVINLGHDVGYFRQDRLGSPLPRPVRVAHTTWKSDIGDQVERHLADDSFTFRSMRRQATWAELRELYHWADVFLCAPNPEEGFYMPALEAMEAGCIVVTPDVGGNMAFCRPGENCVLVEFQDVESYAAALRSISGWPTDTLDRFRRAGGAAATPFDLAAERKAFLDYLETLWKRIDAFERAAGGNAGTVAGPGVAIESPPWA
jgi:glycosyl transferase family 1